MKLASRITAVTFAAALSISAAPAFADQADEDACVSLEEGDDCTRGDGDPGVCVPDESDPGVLTCDDDPSGSGSGGSGGSGAAMACSASEGAPSGGAVSLSLGLALAALAWSRRKLIRG